MCFFGKNRYVAAVACLKRALYLSPFEWIISYNLGLVHLNKLQFASAFHFFSESINLKPDFAASYMYLAITLARLDDFSNSCAAYEKSLTLESSNAIARLNYAITLYNNEEVERSRAQYTLYQGVYNDNLKANPEEEEDEEIKMQREMLADALGV